MHRQPLKQEDLETIEQRGDQDNSNHRIRGLNTLYAT